ncbi:hypothetical protein KU43P_41500 [Pseudomonas sp. KU43P]|nr:hypothetical protein KU43P_41500 [Pseudomonas sp. KU43P]
MRAFGQVDEDQLGRQVEQREHQFDAMGVARLGEVVEFDHGLCSRVGTGVVRLEHMLRRFGEQQNQCRGETIISLGEIIMGNGDGTGGSAQ